MDDDGNKQLSFDEFTTGVRDFGLQVPEAEARGVFERLDKDGSGSVNFDEFLLALRVCSLEL